MIYIYRNRETKHKQNIEVTVVVATYNPIWDKLRRTLCSVILQRNINIEIIVVDDGSENNFFDNIKALFYNYNFHKYTLMDSNSNKGTCINILRGIKAAKGKYLKCISPGDYLYKEETLKELYDYAEKNDISVCFGEAVYYSEEIGNFKVWKVLHSPRNISIYMNKNPGKNALKLNYLVWNDFALGASFFARTDIIAKYLEKIVGKVKYAEDNIFRLMILEGVRIYYFKKIIIWYEFGTGISTLQDRRWNQALKKDMIETNKIMKNNLNGHSFFDIRYRILLKVDVKIQRWVGYFLFPEAVKYIFYKKFFPVYTVTNYNLDFYRKIQMSHVKTADDKEMKV